MKASSGRTQQQIDLTPQEFRRLHELGFKAIPATLSQTMGPNWRHIFFVCPNGPKSRTRVHYYDVDMKPLELYRLAQT